MEQIDVEMQEANAVSLDWRKEAKSVSLNKQYEFLELKDANFVLGIIDERLRGHLYAHENQVVVY